MKEAILASALVALMTIACSGGGSDEPDCEGLCAAMAECPAALEGDCMSQCEALSEEADGDSGGDDCVEALADTLDCIEDLDCDGLFVTIEDNTISILGGCHDQIDDIADTCEELIGNRPPDKPDDDDGGGCPDCG